MMVKICAFYAWTPETQSLLMGLETYWCFFHIGKLNRNYNKQAMLPNCEEKFYSLKDQGSTYFKIILEKIYQ